jgi:radical SAM protein with 4Fe4S-binding SPASM domain
LLLGLNHVILIFTVNTEKHILKWVAIELTGRCNLSCIHCRSWESAAAEEAEAPAEMATGHVIGLLEELARLSSPVVVLSGGEPLLREDVFEIAAAGTQMGLRMCLATNGVLVTPESADRMRASGIRMVSLSIDGPAREVHDDFRRQEGAFDAALSAAEVLKGKGVDFLINSSFTRRNMEHVEATFNLAASLGATAWYMFIVVPTGRGRELHEELIGGEDYERILHWHYEMERKGPPILVRPTCAPQYFRIVAEHAGSGDGFKRRSLKFATGRSKGCLCGQSIALIDRHGNLQPCSYLPLSAGNVLETPVREIWEESKLLLELRDTRSHSECGSCEYREVCGGCRARAYFTTGSHLDKDPVCGYQPGNLRKTPSGALGRDEDE